MKNRRKTMLIAAFAVAVVALAGIGYAATLGYTGTTVNSNNTATGKYITVTQSDVDYQEQFAGIINVDTYTDAHNLSPLYSLADSDETVIATDIKDGDNDVNYYGMKIGADLTLTVAGNVTTNYQIDVKTTGTLAGTSGWIYFLKVVGKNGATEYITNTGSSINGTIDTLSANNDTFTVSLWISSTTLFENITGANQPIVRDSSVPSYHEATSTVSPLSAGYAYQEINVIFTLTPLE